MGAQLQRGAYSRVPGLRRRNAQLHWAMRGQDPLKLEHDRVLQAEPVLDQRRGAADVDCAEVRGDYPVVELHLVLVSVEIPVQPTDAGRDEILREPRIRIHVAVAPDDFNRSRYDEVSALDVVA